MGLAMQIENMAYEAKLLRSLLMAVQEAIYNDSTDYKEYEYALDAVFLMAHDHMEHMESLSNEAYVLQIQEKEAQSRRGQMVCE